MKFVPIKWHRGDRYEKREQRKAAIKNAHRGIRQKSQNQLRKICTDFDLRDYEIIPVEWYEQPQDDTPIEYFDDFVHPSARLPCFD